MSRLVAGAVVFLSSGVAFADSRGEVVSFVCVGGDPCDLQSEMPPGGFVLTDVLATNGEFSLDVTRDSVRVTRLFFKSSNGADNRHFRFASGIPFPPGTTLSHDGLSAGRVVTFLGYIPCPSPCFAGPVPMLGQFGLGVLVATPLAAGGFVIRRRRLA